MGSLPLSKPKIPKIKLGLRKKEQFPIGLDIGAKDSDSTPYNFYNNRLPLARWTDLLPTSVATGKSSAPSFTAYNGNHEAYEFPYNNTKSLMIAFQMPHGWVYGSDIIPHIHFYFSGLTISYPFSINQW